MKKTLLSLAFISLSYYSYAQVGIDTNDPKTTLDVVGNASDATKADGLTAPRLTRTQLIAKDDVYTANQTATLVYVTDLSGTITTKTADVTSIGYYYFDGVKWVKSSATEPWNVQETSTGATSNLQNIYQEGNVAIGTTAADAARIEKLYTNGQIAMEENEMDSGAGTGLYLANGNFFTQSYLRDSDKKNANQKGRSYISVDASGASGYRPYLELFSGNSMEATNNVSAKLSIDSSKENLAAGFGVLNLIASRFGNDPSNYSQGDNAMLGVDANGVKIGVVQDGLNVGQPFKYTGMYGIDGQQYVNSYYLPKTLPTAGQVLMFDSTIGTGTDVISAKTKWANINTIADTTNDAWVNNAASTRVELGTLSNGTTVRPVGTEVVVTDTGRLGIKTASPNATLDVVKSTINPTNSIDGVLPPKMTRTELANKTATTYTNTQNGVIVYVTDASGGLTGTSISQVENVNMPGLYHFDGPTLKWIYIGSNPVITNFRSIVHQALNIAATTDQTITFAAGDSLVNLATVFDDAKDEFTINYDGIYQLSAFIGFNANQTNFTDPRDFVAVNLKILKADAVTPTVFKSVTGIRSVFAGITAGTGTSIQIPTTVLPLKVGDKLKLVIERPGITIGGKSNSNFGDFEAGNGHINLPGGQTYTKSFTILKVK